MLQTIKHGIENSFQTLKRQFMIHIHIPQITFIKILIFSQKDFLTQVNATNLNYSCKFVFIL